MSAKIMADYLSVLTADYTTVNHDLAPQHVMPEESIKKQVAHEYDDGMVSAITLSSTNYFNVTLEWTAAELAPAGTIMDLWHNSSKGNGIARSWYWVHPTDGATYVVKFRGPLTRIHRAGGSTWVEIAQLPLRVIGKKASA